MARLGGPHQLREGLLGTRGQMPSTMCTLGGGGGPDSPQVPNSHTELSLSVPPGACFASRNLSENECRQSRLHCASRLLCLLWRAQPLHLQEGWLA